MRNFASPYSDAIWHLSSNLNSTNSNQSNDNLNEMQTKLNRMEAMIVNLSQLIEKQNHVQQPKQNLPVNVLNDSNN